MILRIAPYTICGFLYYQGEEDVSRHASYSDMLTALVKQWRIDWNDWELPFLFVQLPMYRAANAEEDNTWSMQREQQSIANAILKHTGMIALTDCGEFDNIHPLDKKTPGQRLAQLAEQMVYGTGAEITPTVQTMYTDGIALYVTFSHITDTLILKETVSQTCFIAGMDGIFYPAEAELTAPNTIRISSPIVEMPQSVKYAWYNYGEAAWMDWQFHLFEEHCLSEKRSRIMHKTEQAMPFLLEPVGKDYLWGGERLKTAYNKSLPLTPLAETWECSTHPDGCSVVASGLYKGKTLRSVLQAHPQYLGIYANSDGELPILIKLIDAKKDLSVQVHPDDAYAKQYENGQNGKTEMWYILDAEAQASLVYGFRQEMTPERLRQSLADGTLEQDLQKVPVSKNDVFLIEAGTVHAIGAGIVLAEIQQNSNLTYRLYDYNRIDANGNKRPLHVEKAVATVDYHQKSLPEQKRMVWEKEGYIEELLCTCPYFQVKRFGIRENCNACAKAISTDHTFAVLLCMDGSGVLHYGTSDNLSFQKGQCIFLPAHTVINQVAGNTDILFITL